MTNVTPEPPLPSPRGDGKVSLQQLLSEFYEVANNSSQLANFSAVQEVPTPYDSLLNHESHMTVTIESFYQSCVDVIVHQHKLRDPWYSREITLVTQSDQRVVQYGIVRLKTTAIQDDVWQIIQSGSIPLGRVLIEHDVLRQVELCGLWEIQCGPGLAEKLHCKTGETAYGRTALIHCNGEPAIELLEILSTVKS